MADITDADFTDILSQSFTTEELADKRKKSKAPEGVIVGSPEYWRWWRQQNQLRNRLYQKRAYVKRQRFILASRLSEKKDISFEVALAEIDEAVAATRQVQADIKTFAPVAEEPRIPFIEEEAERHGVQYDIAFKVMDDPDYKGKESWDTFLLTYPPPDESS